MGEVDIEGEVDHMTTPKHANKNRVRGANKKLSAQLEKLPIHPSAKLFYGALEGSLHQGV